MDTGSTEMRYVRLALQKAVRDHLYDPNINLIDFGIPRDREGQLCEDQLAVRFHVHKKYKRGQRYALEAAIERGETNEILPEAFMVDGRRIATDVIEGVYRPHLWGWRPRPQADPRARRADPLRGGVSISAASHNAFATLGCKVLDRATGLEMILSNWHVLVGNWSARPGQLIYQPGRFDGGTYADTVASLARDAMAVNLDAAVALLSGDRELINDQLGLGPIVGVTRPRLGMWLVKSGRRTGVTRGRVTAIEGTARINYGLGDRVIRNVVTIEPMDGREISAGGDSGSVWCDDNTMEAVGLHFAGSNDPECALALDMQFVLDALNVDIALARQTAYPQARRVPQAGYPRRAAQALVEQV
jgi:endonuclease G